MFRFTEEMNNDIREGITYAAFCSKYNVHPSTNTYYNQRKRIKGATVKEEKEFVVKEEKKTTIKDAEIPKEKSKRIIKIPFFDVTVEGE